MLSTDDWVVRMFFRAFNESLIPAPFILWLEALTMAGTESVVGKVGWSLGLRMDRLLVRQNSEYNHKPTIPPYLPGP